jgi:anti-anti-sigma factor
MTLATLEPTTARHDSGSTATVMLPDRFDVHQVPRFERSIADALEVGNAVAVVDASQVRFLDVTAIDALTAARLRLRRQGGELVLAAPSCAARIVLELAGRYEACNPVEADRLAVAA